MDEPTAESSRHGVLSREERLLLAYQLAGMLHKAGFDCDVLEASDIKRLGEAASLAGRAANSN